mgnify:CR=1 FL=1
MFGHFFKNRSDGVEKYLPNLVSWNGGGFDLPVLNYRSLINKVSSSIYFDMGENNSDFKWNNYLNRYHQRHIDLMDVLSGYQLKGRASLDQIASMLGFPGKLGMSGDKVWSCWLNNGINKIRNYCETDVLNTYLVFLRFEYLRGNLDQSGLKEEFELVRTSIDAEKKEHFDEFLSSWEV